ncbi:MAG: protein phosphatase 2C domain-containing protein, partial [Thermoguttaceae bacterium]|nr:protein phosphatase 2C domain-containing protein [Thermoguttaceae bacterium]
KIAKNVWALATYWVGDGAFAVYRPNGEDKVLTLGTPDSGAYAGETRFFTERAEYKSEKIKPRVKMEILRGFDAIILATDGVADPFFDSENALTQFEAWRDFYEGKLPYEILDGQVLSSSSGIFEAGTPEERAEKLLEWLNFQIPGNYDDRTLMIIRPQKPASFKERARKFAVEGARKLVAPVKAAGRCVQKSKAYMQELRKRGEK